MKRVMSAHQPNFLPYLGFFDKMKDSHIFVVRDEVQFNERDWHHRNKIKIQGKDKNGLPNSKWLTVPVKNKKKKLDIKDMVINNEVKIKNVPWDIYMLRQIKSSYETSPFFKDYFPAIEKIISSKKDKLLDLNMDIINFLKESFGIKTEIAYASKLSEYEKTYDPNLDLVNLCKATQSNVYLSGSGGRNYLNKNTFEKHGIEVIFQDFHHPVYKQGYVGFLPNMASIDALFNVGGFPK